MRAVIDALMGAMLFLPGLLLYLYLMAGDTQVTNLAIGLPD